jgi:hypothetical protein
MYEEAEVGILISLSNCLQDVLELTPTIDLNTLFCILNILVFNSPSFPPKIVCQTVKAIEI